MIRAACDRILAIYLANDVTDGTTRQIGVNARLIDRVDAAKMEVTVIDGKNLW